MLHSLIHRWITSSSQTVLPTAQGPVDSYKSKALNNTGGLSRLQKRRIFGGLVFIVLVVCVYKWPNSLPRFGLSKRALLQPGGPPQSHVQLERQKEIKKSFLRAYQIYTKHAWGHDEIKPLSLTPHDPRNGWGATVIDSLSTLHIMNLKEEFEAAVNHTINVSFLESKVKGQPTSLFETTIRYLGATLSAYELSGRKDARLLLKAQELGDKLQMAWSLSQSPIPYAWLHLASNKHNGQETITIAEAGSLTLEFNRLSHWTGNDTYRERADATSRHIMNNTQIFPGLHAQTLLPKTGEPYGDSVGWGANVDSFLEYGVKYWHMIGEPANDYVNYWQQAVDSSILHLLQWSPAKRHPYLAEYSANMGGVQNFMSHLACFAPGNWMLGGKLLGNGTIFSLGLGMAETCYYSYNSTNTGLGPDRFRFDEHDNIFLIDVNFILRPEVVESIWYAWRLTGDPIWQERAWSIFQALEEHCKVSGGYAGLRDVRFPGASRHDSTESFLFSEFFKYLYLTFSDRNYFSLDEWVFSTEGHPFRVDRF